MSFYQLYRLSLAIIMRFAILGLHAPHYCYAKSKTALDARYFAPLAVTFTTVYTIAMIVQFAMVR